MTKPIFTPELCFVASCQWQLPEARISPAQWARQPDQLRPFWSRFQDWSDQKGWLITSIDYGDTGLGSAILDPWRDAQSLALRRVDQFWFGVYTTPLGFVYEIRPAYTGLLANAWPALEHWLDVSDSGYLGFYPALAAAGDLTDEAPALKLHDPHGMELSLPFEPVIQLQTPLYSLTKGKRTPLWHIPALDPAALSAEQVHTNLRLYSPSGQLVRRRVERVAYLNTRYGTPGRFSLQTQLACVPPHPRPQP